MDMQQRITISPELLEKLPDGIYAYLQQEVFTAKLALDSDAWIEAIVILYQGQRLLYYSENRVEIMNSYESLQFDESLQRFLHLHRNLLSALVRKLMQPVHCRNVISEQPAPRVTTVVGHW